MSKREKNNAKSHVLSVTAISPERKGMKAYLEEQKPQEMSISEKKIICMMLGESCQLDYPLKTLKMAYGKDEQIYEIPEEDKEKVLKELWPFSPCPAMDDTLYDLHEDATFVFREAQVIRCRGRNLIVSPYFCKTGGMCVDFLPQKDKDNAFHAIEVKEEN